jgi:hypothetical protein
MSNDKAPAYRRQANFKSNPKFKYLKVLVLTFDIHLAFGL